MTQGLRDELLSVAGVASAEVDVDGDAPSGVRVRLMPQADAEQVGAEVQRVLASHGLRSRVAPDDAGGVPPAAASPSPAPRSAPVAAPGDPRSMGGGGSGATSSAETRPHVPAATVRTGGELASVAFDESADGVSVTAISTDGTRFTRRAAGTTDEAVAAAVVAAVGAMSVGTPQRLIWMGTETVAGSTVVTVLIEKADGSRLAGAAVVRAATAYAVARATWVALRG